MEEVLDVVIVGAGPGGMTAGVYASRANLKVLILEKGFAGGQMMNTEEIENYPSYNKITGPQLSNLMLNHSIASGVIHQYGDVKSIEKLENGLFNINCGKSDFKAKTVILATGTNHLKLGADGELELSGRGISYCAVCDGGFYKNKELVVVGGGDSAVEEAIYLTRYASKVTVLVRGNKFKAQPILVDRLLNNDKVTVMYNTTVNRFVEQGSGFNKILSYLEINSDGQIFDFKVDGAFIYIGMKPNSGLVQDLVKLDGSGYVITDSSMKTSLAGLYAIGDVRNTPLRQIISACGDGSSATRSHITNILN